MNSNKKLFSVLLAAVMLVLGNVTFILLDKILVRRFRRK